MRRPIVRTLRVGACAAVAGLALCSLGSSPAQAATDDIGVAQGAAWLTGELDHGLMTPLSTRNGRFDELDRSLDAADAISAANPFFQVPDTIRAAMDNDARIGDYLRRDPATGATTPLQVNRLARLSGSVNNHGVELWHETAAHVVTAPPLAGELYGGGTIGQAYAVAMLNGREDDKGAIAEEFLRRQECPNGGFRATYDKDTPGSCEDDSEASLPVTGIVVALVGHHSYSPTVPVSDEYVRSRRYLAAAQRPDGSWGVGDAPSDARTTGYAARALATDPATYGDQLAAAAVWVRNHQISYYDLCDNLAHGVGAIAMDDATLARGLHITDAAASDSAYRDGLRAATAYALPVLKYLPADETPSAPVITAPAGFHKAGTQLSLGISGLHAEDRLCLTGSTGQHYQFVADGESATKVVTLPAGTGTRAYAVRDRDGHLGFVHVPVLGTRTLPVLLRSHAVHRNGRIVAVVRGLAPGEAAKVYYGRTLVRSGAASSSGNFVAYIPAGTALGRHYVRGYGQFGDIRKGHTSVTVVR